MIVSDNCMTMSDRRVAGGSHQDDTWVTLGGHTGDKSFL